MDINIKTKDIADKINKDRVDVSVLLVRKLNERNVELERVNAELAEKIKDYEILLDRMQKYVYFCRQCGLIEDKNNTDYDYMYCQICDKQGLCTDCTKKKGEGKLCGECEREWICGECVEKGCEIRCEEYHG